MQITFPIPEFARKERNLHCDVAHVTTKWVQLWLDTATGRPNLLKPATGRHYVRAFSLSGTVPAFTCDCLRFVCAFTPRPKVDMCVSTSSRTMLAFGNNVSFSSSECSTLVAGNMDVKTPASKRSQLIGNSDCSKAPRNPQKVDLCVLASFSCRVCAETQGRKVRRLTFSSNNYKTI